MTRDSRIRTQLYTDAATGELLERSFKLVVVGGPDQGAELMLDGGTAMVGTHPDNDLVLTDDRVSRYHLELQVRREGLQIKDLDSTNGTVHKGVRLGAITVAERTMIRLGKHTDVEILTVDEAIELEAFQGDRLAGVLGETGIMRELFSLLSRVAPTDATILLEGETGTGKEAVAEAVHHLSPRAHRPFIVVDCGAIPHELIGSELFGHAKGSFTGAAADKAGLIEAADGGTLFLDEIGELALDLQPQLLRVLDKRQVRRVGETRAINVDIRVLAATHRDLKAMVKSGAFREDLYYRLAVVKAVVPPLRARLADIPLLAEHFADRLGRGGWALSPVLLEQLQQHGWPGNVRELRNVVERALSLGEAGALPRLSGDESSYAAAGVNPTREPEDVLELPFKEAKAQLVEGFEREYLTHLLDRHRGNISRAANEAGIDRNYIHRLIKKYELKVDRE
ncbi:MAG TPA: sigma 54-interacting transcriptional regulator [Kofleriaceae bacterium]|nr:sigma 54-interacting transcriptional regulator [Kofleriaceae bacterium]